MFGEESFEALLRFCSRNKFIDALLSALGRIFDEIFSGKKGQKFWLQSGFTSHSAGNLEPDRFSRHGSSRKAEIALEVDLGQIF